MADDKPSFRSLHGSELGLGSKSQLMTRGASTPIPVTNNAVDAVITLSGAPTSGFGIAVQLNNADGSPIAHVQDVELLVTADAGDTAALATTGGSTGIEIGANGIIAATVVAKKVFKARTDKTGLLALTWTDSAHEVAFLGVRLPNGRTVYSAALTTA